MSEHKRELALQLFQRAYTLQMQGQFDQAVSLYQESIDLCPTAEAYTFLGWTYRFQGRLEAAIAECKKAIDVDPTFGNPYNDIGAYLIEKGEFAESIPWLEKALESQRYESYHYPWYNLGRAYAAMEMFRKARQCFERSMEIEPNYTLAQQAFQRIRILVQ